MARFITLSGEKQVGKDTSAKIIRQCLISDQFSFYFDKTGEVRIQSSVGFGPLGVEGHKRVHIQHYADSLKRAVNIIFGIPLEDMETEEGKQKLTHVRWPTAIMDDDDPNKTYANVDDFDVVGYVPSSTGEFMTVREVLQFVGTDLFRNQLCPDVWVDSVFRQPWKEDDIVIIADARFPNEIAKRNGLLINIQRETGLNSDLHESETALSDYANYHYVVENNSSLSDLVEKISDIMSTENTLA